MTDSWQNEVRVRSDLTPTDVTYLQQHERTEAQKAQDVILDKAAEHAEAALEHANKALDWLAVVAQVEASKHRSVPIHVQQLAETLAELKRVRG